MSISFWGLSLAACLSLSAARSLVQVRECHGNTEARTNCTEADFAKNNDFVSLRVIRSKSAF